MILLAAEDCQGADRPFGKLKTILSDWMNRGIRTKEDAQKALSSPATPARSYRNTKMLMPPDMLNMRVVISA